MKKLTMLLLLILSAGMVAAQDDVPLNIRGRSGDEAVEIRAAKVGDNTIFTAYKNKVGRYSVCMELDTDMGHRSVFEVVELDSREIFSWPAESGIPRFTYQYYPGEINGKVNNDFVYRLPFAKDAKYSVSVSKNEEYVNYTFEVQENDDVYAMRKGMVTKIEATEWQLRNVLDDKTLRKVHKRIYVEHKDGTTAHYIGVMDGTVTVNEGDMVYPDMVLGKAGTLDEKRYTIIVSIVYLTAPLKGKIPDFDKVKRNALNPMFLTDAGTVQLENGKKYASIVTDKLITEEMTKREQKSRKE